MSRVAWLFGWTAVAVWSLVCAAAYGLFDLVGRSLMRNADAFSGDANVVEGIWRLFSVLHGLSTWAVLVAWAIVSLLILAVPWALDRLLAAPAPGRATVRPTVRGGPFHSRDEGVIDLGPDQYSVGPAGGVRKPAPHAPGPASRIALR